MPEASTGRWETQEIEAFLELLASSQTCVDIGANVGFYSCLAATRGKHVIAVEPLAANLTFLLKNLVDNELADVEVYPLGLSDRPGIKRIYGFRDVASLVKGWAGAVDNVYTTIPVTTLDLIAGTRLAGKATAIKMDVEGFELEVLKGATGTLTMSPKPSWMVEILLNNPAVPGGINDKFYQTFEIFWEHGYECRHTNKDRAVVLPQDVSRLVTQGAVDSQSTNFLFVAK
jgi:FkbM family methyltransferase